MFKAIIYSVKTPAVELRKGRTVDEEKGYDTEGPYEGEVLQGEIVTSHMVENFLIPKLPPHTLVAEDAEGLKTLIQEGYRIKNPDVLETNPMYVLRRWMLTRQVYRLRIE